jgi:hypothetical protein
MELNLDTTLLNKLFTHKNEALLVLEDEYFKEANEVALSYLGVSSIKVFRSLHPALISPEFQPDGVASKIKANKAFLLLRKHRSIRFVWQHITLKGEPFNVEVTLRNRVDKEHNYIDVHWRLLP